jgi:hypothetical protein
MRTIRLLILCLLSLAFLSCKKEKKATESSPAVDAAPATPTDSPLTAQAPTKPTVTLISAGAEPKGPLRFKPKVGDTSEATFTMNMAMTSSDNKSPPMPTMIMKMRQRVDEVAANGDIRYQLEITDLAIGDTRGAPKEMVDQMAKSIVTARGTIVKATMTDRGEVKDSSFTLSPTIDPQMGSMFNGLEQSISQCVSPFPEEPVGLGARWRVNQRITTSGMAIDQMGIFELVEHQGNTGKMKVILEQAAGPQVLPQRVKLESFSTKGTGEIVFQLDRVLPKIANIKARTDTKMHMETDPNQGAQVSIEMDYTIATQ